jgi:hypothetical protein
MDAAAALLAVGSRGLARLDLLAHDVWITGPEQTNGVKQRRIVFHALVGAGDHLFADRLPLDRIAVKQGRAQPVP